MGFVKNISIIIIVIIIIFFSLSSVVYSQGKLIIGSPMSVGHLLSLLNSNNAFNYYFIAGIVVFLFCVLYGIAHLNTGDK
jgi:cell shape-determining protein MreC